MLQEDDSNNILMEIGQSEEEMKSNFSRDEWDRDKERLQEFYQNTISNVQSFSSFLILLFKKTWTLLCFIASWRMFQRGRKTTTGSTKRTHVQKWDIPLNILSLICIIFLVCMAFSLLSSLQGNHPRTLLSSSYSSSSSIPVATSLTLVSYYDANLHHNSNAEWGDCSSGFGQRSTNFNSDLCIEKITKSQLQAGWTEKSLRAQETKLLKSSETQGIRQDHLCICAPMYGSTLPRLTLTTATDLPQHCLFPRVLIYSKDQSTFLQKSKLFPEEDQTYPSGRPITRFNNIALLCTQSEVGTGVEKERLRYLSGPQAHCVQFCVELITGTLR